MARSETHDTVVLDDVHEAATILRNGGLVGLPTETVYGLGADATNPVAVARVFEAKGRPRFDPLIVHAANLEMIQTLTSDFSEQAARLARAFWPGPLTLVLPRSRRIPDLVTSGLPGVGLRIPDHPSALRLIELADLPVAAPSANRFGAISPTTAQHVFDGLAGRIEAVLDGGPTRVGVESTVLSLMGDQPALLRPGGVPVEEIEALVGAVVRIQADPAKEDQAQPAPGMLSRHYAPKTPLHLIGMGQTATSEPESRLGLLTWGARDSQGSFEVVENLSPSSDLRECATHLFAAMRRLDQAGLDRIVAHGFPDQGLGVALNDRLRRASDR